MLPARSDQTPPPAPSSQTPAKRRPRPPNLLEQERWNVEILRGVRLMSPRPAPPHALVAGALFNVLYQKFHRRGGGGHDGSWWILHEPELQLADGDLAIPDLAAWRRARVPAFPRKGPLAIMPDWLCEVLSPSTERNDRRVKMSLYHAAGVEHVWLMDPEERVLERFQRGETEYTRIGHDIDAAVVHAAPFESLALDLSEIWPAE